MVLFADSGVPMIGIFLPAAWLAIIPIILIEAFVGTRITKLPYRELLLPATLANLFSAVLGIPLTWIALGVMFSICPWIFERLDWLLPLSDNGNYPAWVPPLVVVVVVAVPFYLTSVVSEYLVARFMVRSLPSSTIWRWMWKGNAASYVFLVLLGFLILLLRPPLDLFFLLPIASIFSLIVAFFLLWHLATRP